MQMYDRAAAMQLIPVSGWQIHHMSMRVGCGWAHDRACGPAVALAGAYADVLSNRSRQACRASSRWTINIDTAVRWHLSAQFFLLPDFQRCRPVRIPEVRGGVASLDIGKEG